VTGCGCLGVVAALVALLVIFIRGSFDSGEPIEQAVVLAALALATVGWQREWTAHKLVRARRA